MSGCQNEKWPAKKQSLKMLKATVLPSRLRFNDWYFSLIRLVDIAKLGLCYIRNLQSQLS